MDNQQMLFRLIKLFFNKEGRMSRSRYWLLSLPFWLIFWILFFTIDQLIGSLGTNILTLIFLLGAFFLSAKRLHDTDKSSWWLLVILIPLIGPVWAFIELACRRGSQGDNRYGEDPLDSNYDYFTLP